MIEVSKKRLNYVFHELPQRLEKPVRPFQLEGIKFGLTRHKSIIGDDPGLGKTVQALAVAYLVDPDHINIACGKSSLSVWPDQIEYWFPDWKPSIEVVEGNANKRQKLLNSKASIKVSTFQTLTIAVSKGEIGNKFEYGIGDEAHKLRNKKTKLFDIFDKMHFHRLQLLTGSPIKKGAQDMWTLLHLVYPSLFPSYWRYVNTFCDVYDGMFGREIIGMKNTEKWRELTKGVFLRRDKKDPEIANQLPAKLRDFIKATPDKQQAQIYNKLADDMIVSINNNHYLYSSVLALNTKLRQLMVCPKLIDKSLGIGSGIEHILQHIEDQEIDKAVIFSMYPASFEFLKPYLQDKGFMVEILRGGMKAAEVHRISKEWFSMRGVRQIVLCSIQFAESFDLVQASTGYMLGASYDVEENKQAEDRLQRMSSTEPVNIWYVRYDLPVEDNAYRILDVKSINITHVLKDAASAKALLTQRRPK